MAVKTDIELKQFFETNDVPTQQQYFDLIDSKVNVGASPPAGMSIGGAVSGGAIGNILFVGAGVTLQQDGVNFNYDFVNKRLGMGVIPLSRVHFKGDTNADPAPLQVRFERPAGAYNSSTNWQSHSSINGAGQAVGTMALAQQAIGQGTRWNWTVTLNSTTTAATEGMRLSQSKQLSVGGTILDGAVVDIFSKGNLSTDLNLRVRNNANTLDLFRFTGTGQLWVGNSGALLSAIAIAQFDSTTQGILFPRMTTVQRDAIPAPIPGLVIFNTTTNKLNVRGALAWEAVTSV